MFEWLPWGKPGCFREIQASTAQLTESDKCGIQTLGDPQVSLVESQDIDVSDVPAKLRPGEDKLEVFIIDERVDLEESGGTTFWGNMSNGSQRANGRGNWKGSGSGRGALPPSGPSGRGKPPPYYPPYPPMPAPSVQGAYFSSDFSEDTDHVIEEFRPPSPPRGPRSEGPKTGQKRHHFETELEDAKREVRRDRAPSSYRGRSTIPADRVPRRSPSPDVKEALADDDDRTDLEPPVLIKVPQLDGPLAFTPEALRTWGRAHLDQSDRTTQFREQLIEWKNTKVELRQTLAQAYEDTRVLKEHVVSNDVSQEHIYALHVQVKRTATRVREASRNIDDLIAIALKQMTLNVDAVRDFGTVLRAIPAEAMGIQDFYRSIRSFYVGLLERLVKKYGPNQPFIINIAHSFEHFLQTCDFLEPLPGGYAQFTGMMASIIRDVYDIDMDKLKSAA